MSDLVIDHPVVTAPPTASIMWAVNLVILKRENFSPNLVFDFMRNKEARNYHIPLINAYRDYLAEKIKNDFDAKNPGHCAQVEKDLNCLVKACSLFSVSEFLKQATEIRIAYKGSSVPPALQSALVELTSYHVRQGEMKTAELFASGYREQMRGKRKAWVHQETGHEIFLSQGERKPQYGMVFYDEPVRRENPKAPKVLKEMTAVERAALKAKNIALATDQKARKDAEQAKFRASRQKVQPTKMKTPKTDASSSDSDKKGKKQGGKKK